MRYLLSLSLLAAFGLTASAQDDLAKRVYQRFEASKPADKDLAFYSLDWTMSLKEAQAKAAKEHRPILLILNTNITAGTNFFSGHT